MSSAITSRRNSLELVIFDEIGESPPESALLFDGADISIISGKSRDLMYNGYEPFNGTHLNTQQALMVTHALASLHAKTVLFSDKSDKISNRTGICVFSNIHNSKLVQSDQVESTCTECLTCIDDQSNDSYTDPLTQLISRPSIVEANLSIMLNCFKLYGVSSSILEKLEAIRQDVNTITGFLTFLASSENSKYIPSVGPISMCDIWLPKNSESPKDLIVIRLRGGSHLKSQPFRDISWVWITLVHPIILQERYMELCQSYCIAFNKAILPNDAIPAIDLSDIVKELGENFLHAFLTIVHKFVASGVWALDRQLHTSEGIRLLSSSISFLIENGIVGPIFVS